MGLVDKQTYFRIRRTERNATIDAIAQFLRARSSRLQARAIDVELTIKEMEQLKWKGAESMSRCIPDKFNPRYEHDYLANTVTVICSCGWRKNENTQGEAAIAFREHVQSQFSAPAPLNVVPFKEKPACLDIVKTLRVIADDIEKGEYGIDDPDFAVLVVGRESQRRVSDGIDIQRQQRTHAMGDAGFYAVKGLLAAAIVQFETGIND